MDEIKNEIKEWLLKQDLWLQESAKRLLEKGALTEEDLQVVYSVLFSENKDQVSVKHSFDSIFDAVNSTGQVRLLSIGNINGIENLAPREPLEFGKGNLTVIYGHNGSGKSSYTKLLKNISGKPRAEELKPNVFEPLVGERKCEVSYQVDEKTLVSEWLVDSPAVEGLRVLDVFDSSEAAYYLNNENTATYTPAIIKLFESLASVCGVLRTRLEQAESKLISTLPSIHPNYLSTELAKRFQAINVSLTEEVIMQLFSWVEADQQELNSLNERLKTADPAALAEAKRAQIKHIKKIVEELQKSSRGYGANSIKKISELKNDALQKRQIAVEGAQVKSAKLEGVGTATWRALWEAAKQYSQATYPTQTFPLLDENLCVLCHQELSSEAQQRQIDFESFTQSQLETTAKGAESAYKAVLADLPAVPTDELIESMYELAGLNNNDWKKHLKDIWSEARVLRASLLKGGEAVSGNKIEASDETIKNLNQFRDQLIRQAAQLDQDAVVSDRELMEKSKLELEAKQWFSQQTDEIKKEVQRLKSLQKIEALKRTINPRVISTKASTVAEKVITEAYVNKFRKELKALGASHIKVELIKTRTSQGKVLHQLQLKGVANNKNKIETVLSEGERRIISLAAFLADVGDKPFAAPFIFDDPISSLDHDFEWAVARRLAELSKKRQVIVLTHRLSLYGAMDDAAKKISENWRKDNLTQLLIESYGGKSGHTALPAAWNTNTKKANNTLLLRLEAANKIGEENGADAYRSLAQGICSDFRKLLERSVEDDLLNQIVRRHRRSVTTDNRLNALPLIEPSDCQLIDDLMTKYSSYEHSQSEEAPVFIPEEAELRQDLEMLKKWREELKEKRKKAA